MLDRLSVAGIQAGETFQGEPSMLGRLRSMAVSGLLFACAGGALAFTALPFLASGHQATARLTLRQADEAGVIAATRALKSRQSLDNLIGALDLARAEGFAVNVPTLYSLASELLSGNETTMAETEQALRDRLLEAMSITHDAAGRTVLVTVTAADRAEAVAIADRLAEEFRRSLATTAAARPSPQVEALRNTVERADAALTGFTGKYDAAGLARLQAFEDRATLKQADIDAAERQLAGLQASRDAATGMTLAGVLNDPLPDSLEFTGLEYQRQRYVQSQRELEHLSAELGPRHPRRVAAQAAFDDAKADLGKALRQLVASLGAQVKSAEEALASVKAAPGGVSGGENLAAEAGQFELLRTASDEAHRNLAKAEANAESAGPARLPRLDPVAPASAATSRVIGPDPAMIIYGGAAAGFALGVAFAALRRRRQMQIAEEVYDFETELDVPQSYAEPAPVMEMASAVTPVAATARDVMPAAFVDLPAVPDHGWASEQQWREEAANDMAGDMANDMAFGDRMRGLLLDNSLSADHAYLPPLLSVAVQNSRERIEEARVHGWLDDHGHLPEFDEEELNALQRELSLLRELVALEEDREYRRAS